MQYFGTPARSGERVFLAEQRCHFRERWSALPVAMVVA